MLIIKKTYESKIYIAAQHIRTKELKACGLLIFSGDFLLFRKHLLQRAAIQPQEARQKNFLEFNGHKKIVALTVPMGWWGWPDLNRRPLPGNSACLSLRVSLRPLQNFVIPEAGQQTRCLLSGARRHTCLDYSPTYT
jgi:hypothetical protein